MWRPLSQRSLVKQNKSSMNESELSPLMLTLAHLRRGCSAFSVINYGQQTFLLHYISCGGPKQAGKLNYIVSRLIKSSTGLLSYKQPQLGR